MFKIEATDFTAPDCTVTIRDGQTPTATVTLDGCTASVTSVPTTPAPSMSSCVITPQAPLTLTTGTSTGVYVDTTGCNATFDSGATPLRCSGQSSRAQSPPG